MRASSHPTRRPDVKTYVLPDGTTLLFDPAAEGGLPLDVLSSLIWDYCDGALSADEIVHEIEALLPQVADVASHTLAAVDEFARLGLLLGLVPSPNDPEGLSGEQHSP